MHRLPPITLLAAAMLAGCGSTPQQPLNGRPAPGPAAPPTPARPLQAEQRWLEEWFRGTPVVIRSDPRGALQVDVPLRNSFDVGRTEVKPALDAVLVRVVAIMRRQPTAVLHLVVPRDPNSDGSLALDRGDKVSDRLASLGLAPKRIASVLVGAPSAMQLRLAVPAP